MKLAKWFNVIVLFYIVMVGQDWYVAFVVTSVMAVGWPVARKG